MEQVTCYCGGNLACITLIDTRKAKHLENLPIWPSDKLLLIPWKEFGDERNSCPRCGNEKD